MTAPRWTGWAGEIPATRLIYLATTLQRATADLYYSSNRRTDAELCLLRLCDESLWGPDGPGGPGPAAGRQCPTGAASAGGRRRSGGTVKLSSGPVPPRHLRRRMPRLGKNRRHGRSALRFPRSRLCRRSPERGCSTYRRRSPAPSPAAASAVGAVGGGRWQKGLQGPPAAYVPGVSGYVHRCSGGRPADGLCPG